MGVLSCKLKTLLKIKFTSKIIIFQKTLQFKHVIAFYYGRQQSLALQGCVPSLQVWAIIQIIFNTLGPMVKQCVLNQSQGHLLFFDVFVVTISTLHQMWVDFMTPYFNEALNFDGRFQIFKQHMKNKSYKFWIPSFHLCFVFTPQGSHHVGYDVRPPIRGLGWSFNMLAKI